MPEWLSALLSSGVDALEPAAILLARFGVGLMFAFSGWHKLRSPERYRQLVETMERASIPCPWMAGPLVAATELAAGSLLVVGLLTIVAAFALLVITVVAIATVAIDKVDAGRLSTWLENFLYLPEVLYALLLVSLIASGPGFFSLDRLIWNH
ncbi:hypothetical protein BH24PSE2_BH24PSE2_08130 [soil metagenome]